MSADLPGAIAQQDSERATAAVAGAVAIWATARDAAVASGATIDEAVAEAARRSMWKASQLAVTEVSDTWAGERERFFSAGRWRGLWKIWDAVLDRSTCSVCSGMHGTAVPVGESFPPGEPGQVHPGCRCSAIVVGEHQVDEAIARTGAPIEGAIVVNDAPAPRAPTTEASARAPRPVARPVQRPDREAPTVARPAATAESQTPARLTRPRRIDVAPLPLSPAARPLALQPRGPGGQWTPGRRVEARTFPTARPPSREEVRARQRANRIATEENKRAAAARARVSRRSNEALSGLRN